MRNNLVLLQLPGKEVRIDLSAYGQGLGFKKTKNLVAKSPREN